MQKTTLNTGAPAAQPSPLAGHPVFRGFESLGVTVEDLARMCGVRIDETENWRNGRAQLPGPWAILMTRMLGVWIRNADTGTGLYAPDGDPSGLGASRLDGARNWLNLAEEANKDFTGNDIREADRLASARADMDSGRVA